VTSMPCPTSDEPIGPAITATVANAKPSPATKRFRPRPRAIEEPIKLIAGRAIPIAAARSASRKMYGKPFQAVSRNVAAAPRCSKPVTLKVAQAGTNEDARSSPLLAARMTSPWVSRLGCTALRMPRMHDHPSVGFQRHVRIKFRIER
jgi:hypothetical protein